MGNILLVNTLTDFAGVNVISLCALSAVLKRDGHRVELLDCSSPEPLPANLAATLADFVPDLVGINVMTSHQLPVARAVSAALKKMVSVPVIAGGMAVSLDPDSFIRCPDIDAVCMGEGEGLIAEVARAENAGAWSGLPSLANRQGENPVRPLIENLDSLPLLDLSLFGKSLKKFTAPYIALMANRGCPYDCAYCANATYQGMFPNRQHYTRYRNPELVVQEMVMAKTDYPSRFIYFEDDTFTLNDEWLAGFVEALARAGLRHPFSINVRLERLKIELVGELMRFGLDSVRFGLETGDEDYRREVLQRDTRNRDYRRNARALNRLGLKLKSYYMLGLPLETGAMLRKTVRLNFDLKVDDSGYQSFKPYKGVALREFAAAQGLIICEPEDCGEINQSYRQLFVKTRYSPAAYAAYLQALAGVDELAGKHRWLNNWPRLKYLVFLMKYLLASRVGTA